MYCLFEFTFNTLFSPLSFFAKKLSNRNRLILRFPVMLLAAPLLSSIDLYPSFTSIFYFVNSKAIRMILVVQEEL